MNLELEPAYYAQLDKMRSQACNWLDSHPEAAPKIQWNHPPGSIVIMSIGRAIEYHIVTTNAEGRELLDAMCAGLPDEKEPTVMMCRGVMESLVDRMRLNIPDAPNIPPSACPACGKILNSASGVNEAFVPDPGTISVCFDCAEISEFDADLKLVPLSAE
ncbi:MAG: hypothetical protein V4710_05200, partial [Verrucomicrobiota bacterium]